MEGKSSDLCGQSGSEDPYNKRNSVNKRLIRNIKRGKN